MAETILVVDDDVDGLKITALMLQRRGGYEIIPAYSGAMGLERARSHQPDLILLDSMMEDMGGNEVLRRIRADSDIRHIPVIMYTAKTLIDDKIAGFEAGADDYLTKPAHPGELVTRVKAVLARSRANPLVRELRRTGVRSLPPERIEELRKTLIDPTADFTTRVYLFEQFAELPAVDLFADIQRHLIGDPVGSIRQMAVEALWRFDTPEAAVLLMFRLHDREDYVREAAIEALTLNQHPLTVRMLASMLDDPRPEKALLAVRVLARQSSPAARDLLRRAAAHPLAEVSAAASAALERMFPVSADASSAAAQASQPTADSPAISEDQRGYVALVNLLTHPDLAARGTAVIALSVLRRQSPILRETPAQDAFWRNVYHNLASMAETAPAHWGELSELAHALTLPAAEQNIRLRELAASSDNMDIRASAARALGQNRDAESASVLQACVTETDNSKLVAAALEALGLIGGATAGDDALPVILGMLASPTTGVRFAAVNSLAFIGSDAAAKQLRALLDSPNSATRIDAIRALARPESRIAAEIAVRMLLVVAVRDRDANVLHTVAQTLGQLDTPQSDNMLRMLLIHDSDHVKNGARKGIEALARLRARST